MAEYLATICAGLWTGAAIYIAIFEHPSVIKLGVNFATAYLRRMSRRTAPLMMILSAAGGFAGLFAWLVGRQHSTARYVSSHRHSHRAYQSQTAEGWTHLVIPRKLCSFMRAGAGRTGSALL